jgi:predicted TIM-barrel fold metal-dependent hydrolase
VPDFRIFDAHQHIGALDTGANEGHITTWSTQDDYARRTEMMDRFGVDAGIAMPSLQYLKPNGYIDTQSINENVARFRATYAERFPVALGTSEPMYGEAIAVREIDRIAEELHLDGVVWHHRFQGCFLADAKMNGLLRACAKHGLPAFFHVIADSNMEAPWMLEELYQAHPEVTFVACDAFSGPTQVRFVMQMAERCPNLLFDTAVAFPLMRYIEEFVRRHGSERLIFGTDLYVSPPTYHYPHVLREILEAPALSDVDKQNILCDNAERLFGRTLVTAATAAPAEV